MSYIKPEYKKILERDLFFLAKKIMIIAREQIGESPLKRTAPYRYACWTLGPKALPAKRYTLLSGIRASFGDALDEWCRRRKVNPQRVEFISCDFPTLNKRVDKLARKIKKIVIDNKDCLNFQRILTYCHTALGLKITDNGDKIMERHVAGTLKHLYRDKSFYPTIMAPYEDEQTIKNGDVYPEIRR